MLWALVRKEMLANVTSFRFALMLLLATVVFSISGIVFVGRYRQEMRDFNYVSSENLSGLEESSKNLSRIPSYVQTIRRRPNMAQLCCEAFEKYIPNTFWVNGFTVQHPEIISRSNLLYPRFADVDWAFIISLILSFAALLMIFDSFSAERERGTLRLVLSNPIPRHKVILGKYLSGMLTLMIPLFVGILLNLIIVRWLGLSFMSSRQWARVMVFVALSIIYLSGFILLGMLISSRSAKSSTSIMVLLFVWVIIVMIIPGVGRIVAERFVHVHTLPEVRRQIREAQREIRENSERYGKNVGNWGPNPHSDSVNPPARARLYNALTDARNRVIEQHINKMVAQISLGRNVTRISPTVIYQCASEETMGTGIVRFQALYSQLKRYKEVLRDFVMSVDERDPDSFHLWAEYHPVLLSQKPVNYDVIPRFEEMDTDIGSALGNIVWNIGALILLNVLLFMGVYISFLNLPCYNSH